MLFEIAWLPRRADRFRDAAQIDSRRNPALPQSLKCRDGLTGRIDLGVGFADGVIGKPMLSLLRAWGPQRDGGLLISAKAVEAQRRPGVQSFNDEL